MAFVVFYQELEAPSVYTVIYHHTWFVASNLVHSSRGFVYFEIQPHRSPAGVWVLGWKQHWGNLLSLAKKLSVIINGFRNFEHVPASYLSLMHWTCLFGLRFIFPGHQFNCQLGKVAVLPLMLPTERNDLNSTFHPTWPTVATPFIVTRFTVTATAACRQTSFWLIKSHRNSRPHLRHHQRFHFVGSQRFHHTPAKWSPDLKSWRSNCMEIINK